jgi:hypothetical protein
LKSHFKNAYGITFLLKRRCQMKQCKRNLRIRSFIFAGKNKHNFRFVNPTALDGIRETRLGIEQKLKNLTYK